MEVKVYQAKNKFFAEIVKGFLESNGIFALVRVIGFIPHLGDACPAAVYVRRQDEGVARELIRDFTL